MDLRPYQLAAIAGSADLAARVAAIYAKTPAGCHRLTPGAGGWWMADREMRDGELYAHAVDDEGPWPAVHGAIETSLDGLRRGTKDAASVLVPARGTGRH